jgi:hypothetical protein
MPCQDYGRPSYIDNPETKQRLDHVTRLLCEVMTKIDREYNDQLFFHAVDGLEQWWTEHQEQDRKRKDREDQEKAAFQRQQALKAGALAKLTPEERKVLGLK